MRWTEDDLAAHLRKIQKPKPAGRYPFPPADRSKYRAKRTQVGDIWFDSKREAERYQQLHIMQTAGAIADLELQPRFELRADNGEVCAHYRADFRYLDLSNGEIVVEDVKSPITRKETAYRLRKKWAQACHGIQIREI